MNDLLNKNPQQQLGAAINTMTSREIADLVESRHDNVKVAIERLAAKGVIQLPAIQDSEIINGLGKVQKVSEYLFDQSNKRDSFVVVAQLSPEFTARLVDRWQELEEKSALHLPDFSDPVIAARAWANQYEARLIAERTKAEIGSRREATAMNTASIAVKQVKKLEVELDKSKQYATVKRMGLIYHGQVFNWRLLKSTSIEIEIPAIDVFDANYGTVKAYHADVWREAYAVEIEC